MSAPHVLIFVLILNLGLNFLAFGQELCDESVRVKLDGLAIADEKSSIIHNDTIFENGTFWKSGDDYFGCPCLVKNCIRFCNSVPGADFDAEIWFDEEQSQTVKLHEHFYVIPLKDCAGFSLDPGEANQLILSNGSLRIPDYNITYGTHSFCLIFNKNNITPKFCDDELENGVHEDNENSEKSNWKKHVYPVFFIISIFFLVLTEIAFLMSPAMRNLHGKNIACQSGTLMMGFIGLTVTYLTGVKSHKHVCMIFAYLTYFFMLSSFFWLSTMGFDIFLTFSDFKKMTGSVHQTHKKKFKMYAIYSTFIPLSFFSIMVVLDQFLDTTSSLWPGIGEKRCWFKDELTEFQYFHGPVCFLLMANIAFFSVTMFKIHNMKKEGRVLKRCDSKTHNGRSEAEEDEQRFLMFIKLFILMGGTWLMELLSWIIGGSEWIWFIPDLINCSRGVLIFVLCVWNNKKVRASFLKSVSSQFASFVESSEINSKTCELQDVSITAMDPTIQQEPEMKETPC